MGRIAWIWKATAAMGGVVTVLAQTKPEEAIGNIAGWAKLAGIAHLPSFLTAPSFDLLLTIAGIVTVLVSLVMWRRQFVHIHQNEMAAEVKVTASIDAVVNRAPLRDTAQDPEDTIRAMLREQRLEQLELDHRLGKHDSLSDARRANIADCRKMIAEYDGGYGLSNQRKAMYKNVGFLAIKSHLPDHFLETLDKNILGIVDTCKTDIPVMMNALNSHLSRLEKEWGLE